MDGIPKVKRPITDYLMLRLSRRVDGSLTFYDKTWKEYKRGFNNGLDSNLWLGNDIIHVLSTKDATVELRIDLWGDRAAGAKNPSIYLYGKYASFSVSTVLFRKHRILNNINEPIQIENEANYYTSHISSPSIGNASDPGGDHFFNYHNGLKFSTIDVSHDYGGSGAGNCSGDFGLGFVLAI